jgi:hypothetical protein
MVNHDIVELCRAYAELVCSARRLGCTDYATCLCAAGRQLYDSAPIEAIPHLDTVKRVLEIDTSILPVSVVLLRASVLFDEEVTLPPFGGNGP